MTALKELDARAAGRALSESTSAKTYNVPSWVAGFVAGCERRDKQVAAWLRGHADGCDTSTGDGRRACDRLLLIAECIERGDHVTEPQP